MYSKQYTADEDHAYSPDPSQVMNTAPKRNTWMMILYITWMLTEIYFIGEYFYKQKAYFKGSSIVEAFELVWRQKMKYLKEIFNLSPRIAMVVVLAILAFMTPTDRHKSVITSSAAIFFTVTLYPIISNLYYDFKFYKTRIPHNLSSLVSIAFIWTVIVMATRKPNSKIGQVVLSRPPEN